MTRFDRFMVAFLWVLTVLGTLSAVANLGFFVYGGHRLENLAVGVTNIFSVATAVFILRISARIWGRH